MTSPFAEDRPFYSNSMTKKPLFPTDYTPDLIDAATAILEKNLPARLHLPKMRCHVG
jgi:hypothetical protein